MKTKGVRILDAVNEVICVQLPDILKEIDGNDSYFWSILSLDAMGNLGLGKSLISFEEEIRDAERGLFITWNDLNQLAPKFHQIIDTEIIGCKDKNLLRHYSNDQEMYETCDIVIVMFDSGYWEIFSKDESLINRLANKFKEVELLESDFLR